MRDSKPSDWLEQSSRWYYSQIDGPPPYVVDIRSAAVGQEVSDAKPGTLILRLHPRGGTVRVIDARGGDRGGIRSQGILRGRRFVMRRDNTVVWTSTVRSLVRKRHSLQLAGGEIWTIDTPFYWRLNFTATLEGRTSLVGHLGPTMKHWGFKVEPGRETDDLLAAVGFLHWKWWTW